MKPKCNSKEVSIFTVPSKKYFHICWFADPKRMNLNEEKEKRMWLQMVLTRGRAANIRELDFAEVKKFLPDLFLPGEVKKLWADYFLKKQK